MGALADRELIERHVAGDRQASGIGSLPHSMCEAVARTEDPNVHDLAPRHAPTTIMLPWTASSFQAVKGIGHVPCATNP